MGWASSVIGVFDEFDCFGFCDGAVCVRSCVVVRLFSVLQTVVAAVFFFDCFVCACGSRMFVGAEVAYRCDCSTVGACMSEPTALCAAHRLCSVSNRTGAVSYDEC